jgi:hypothetical protein
MMLPSSTVREMFQQDTNKDFQVATIHFSVRNLVRAIANFKLQIATIKIFISTCRPYNVQLRTFAYLYFFECDTRTPALRHVHTRTHTPRLPPCTHPDTRIPALRHAHTPTLARLPSAMHTPQHSHTCPPPCTHPDTCTLALRRAWVSPVTKGLFYDSIQ